MKHFLSTFLIFVFVLGLVGCSNASTTTTTSDGAAAQTQDDSVLPLVTRLAVGTLNLENTEKAVTSEQAGELLTLWQAYDSLSNSDTISQTELDALVEQIQDTLTTEQVQAIEDMQLTRQSMGEIIQSLGLMPPMQVDANGTPMAMGTPMPWQTFTEGEFPEGRFPEGGFPEGGFPADGAGRGGGVSGRGMPDMPPDGGGMGGMFGGANGMGPGAQITPNATDQARWSSRATRVTPFVLNALINLLETRTQE